jgi:hypothetical protein
MRGLLRYGLLTFALLATLLTMAITVNIAGAESSSSQKNLQQYYASIYPCTKCHATMKLTGMTKISKFHNIDLTKGAHKGLYCANCHVPPYMINLRGGAMVYIPGLHNRSLLMETNKLCAICHPQEYSDYMNLIHGNKTYVCPGGKVEEVVGYKNVTYLFHVCPNGYRNLTTMPARACVECHDPHTPTMGPLNILPKPSERPAPPDETAIAWGDFIALLAALVPIAMAFAVKYREGAR